MLHPSLVSRTFPTSKKKYLTKSKVPKLPKKLPPIHGPSTEEHAKTQVEILCFLFSLNSLRFFANERIWHKNDEPKAEQFVKHVFLNDRIYKNTNFAKLLNVNFKRIFWYPQFFQKMNEKTFALVGRSNFGKYFVRFLGESRASIFAFEIYWPLRGTFSALKSKF